MTAPFQITSNSLSSITSYIVQYILTWLQFTTHRTLLVFHSRMLGRDLSPGTIKMGGKWSNPLQRAHRKSGAQPHRGTTSSRALSKQQVRRNTTPFWMEACTAPVTKPACQRRRYVTKRTRQPGTDQEALFIPVHKVKIHLLSWR